MSETHMDLEIRVQQELELEALLALVAHAHDRLQRLFCEGHTVL